MEQCYLWNYWSYFSEVFPYSLEFFCPPTGQTHHDSDDGIWSNRYCQTMFFVKTTCVVNVQVVLTILFPDMRTGPVLQHWWADFGRGESYFLTPNCLMLFPATTMFSIPTDVCVCTPILPHSNTPIFSQQPNNEAPDEIVKPVPTMRRHYSCRRLGCLICMKLCADSYDYKLPFVTVKQISVTTV